MNKKELIEKYEVAIKTMTSPKIDGRTTLGRYLKYFDKVVQYSENYLLAVKASGFYFDEWGETKYTLHSLETGQNWTILKRDTKKNMEKMVGKSGKS